MQLTEMQLHQIRTNERLQHGLFYWAEAMVQRNVDHESDMQAEIWGTVNEALGIATDSGKTISVTPVLVAVEPIDTPDGDENAPLAMAIVWLMFDETESKQWVYLDWVKNPEA